MDHTTAYNSRLIVTSHYLVPQPNSYFFVVFKNFQYYFLMNFNFL